ncbi:hypothetical protein K439DRAFT_1620559 [Ramaria rubella]|nr:hypothetical protein K439DRAFT_1620559 [Ramaria rubella]
MSLEDDKYEPHHVQEPTNHSHRLWSGNEGPPHYVSPAGFPTSNPTYDKPGVHTPATEALSTFQAQVHALVTQCNHARIQGPFGPEYCGDAFPFEDHIHQLNQIAQLVSSVKTHAIDEISAQREMLLATIQEQRTQLFLDKQQWMAQLEPIPDNQARTYDVKASKRSIFHIHSLLKKPYSTVRHFRFSTNAPRSSHRFLIVHGHHSSSLVPPHHQELQLYSECSEDAALCGLLKDLSLWNTREHPSRLERLSGDSRHSA